MENAKISRIAIASLVVGGLLGLSFFAGLRYRKNRTNVVPEYNDLQADAIRADMAEEPYYIDLD